MLVRPRDAMELLVSMQGRDDPQDRDANGEEEVCGSEVAHGKPQGDAGKDGQKEAGEHARQAECDVPGQRSHGDDVVQWMGEADVDGSRLRQDSGGLELLRCRLQTRSNRSGRTRGARKVSASSAMRFAITAPACSC